MRIDDFARGQIEYGRFKEETIKVYGAADPVNPSCEQTSAPMGLTFPDPVPVHPVDFGCVTPGKDLLASVTVTVERIWPSGGGWMVDQDVSTTNTGWVTSTNDWQEVELDSTDSSGPDHPDLEFHATVRYRTIRWFRFATRSRSRTARQYRRQAVLVERRTGIGESP